MQKYWLYYLICAPLVAQQPNASHRDPQNTQKVQQIKDAPLTNENLMTKDTSSRCVESYLAADKIHDGTDYGAAITAAVKASSLLSPTKIRICMPGDHPIYTQAYFDRPVHFDMSGSKLVTQNSLGSIPVSVKNAKVIAGSKTIEVGSTEEFLTGQTIGGLGITSGSYITSVGNGTITLSLLPGLVINGYIVEADTTVKTSNSLAGIAVGQELNGYGIPAGTKIAAINYSEPQSITLSKPPMKSINTSVALSVSSGTWTVPVLTAVKATPAMVWGWNNAALHNEFDQMIGGSMRNVWIIDKTIRRIPGVQGIQIYGWDGFNAYNTRVELLDGTGLILGGIVPSSIAGTKGSVRESYFYDTKIRYAGSSATSQAAMNILTPVKAIDEENQLGFSGCQLVSELGESLTIGSLNPTHTGTNGPRLIWFSNNCQIEGGSYLGALGIPSVNAQFDAVHILQAGDVYFSGTELASQGYGKALIRVDQADTVSITSSRVFPTSDSRVYTVNVKNGSKAIHWAGSDDDNGFVVDGTWNGIAAIAADGGRCTSESPCIVHLDPNLGVPDSKTLMLSSSYTGTTNKAARFVMTTTGYGVNVTGRLGSLFVEGSEVNFSEAGFSDNATIRTLGASNNQQTLYVGEGPLIPGVQESGSVIPGSLNSLTVYSAYDSKFLPLITAYAPNLTNDHFIQRFFGAHGSNNDAGVEQFFYSGSGDPNNQMTWGLYGNQNFFSFNGNGVLRAPAVNAVSGYKFNGTAGFTGTKKTGNCIFTIQGGIITNVAGC